MITFKGKDKTLNSYVEMGVSFGQGEKGDPFEDFTSFEHAVRTEKISDDQTKDEDKNTDDLFKAPEQRKSNLIKSSSHCEYNNQEEAWRKFATKHGYDGLKDLANAVTKLNGPDAETFCGMEGLAALTGNKELLDSSDYGNAGELDQLITSMFYGGGRLKQWKKYAKPYITPLTFINELMNADEYDSLGYTTGVEKVEQVNKNTVKVYFGGEKYRSSVPLDEGKKTFHKMMEDGDELFDFSIAEDFESNIWTITVK